MLTVEPEGGDEGNAGPAIDQPNFKTPVPAQRKKPADQSGVKGRSDRKSRKSKTKNW